MPTTDLSELLEHLPKEPVAGWTWALEYPGFIAWTHPDLPNGFLAATPFWSDDDTVQVEWQTYDGEVYPMAGFSFRLTDDPAEDAVRYVVGVTVAIEAFMNTLPPEGRDQ